MPSARETKSRNAQRERQTESSEVALRLGDDLLNYARQYTRERPEVVAMWCLGIGFVLGWKLKPW
jgi:hypothetical protein